MTMTTNDQQQKYEYRMVCAYYGQDAHQLHHYPKRSFEKVEQAVIDANHKAEMSKDEYWYQECAPYKGQVRPVSEWADTNPRDL